MAFFSGASELAAQGSAAGSDVADSSALFRIIPQNAFSIGEKITLSVRYMGIPCGELEFYVSDLTTYRDRPVYVVHVHARTNRAFAFLYTVSDTLTSYVDAEGLFSWRHIKEIHEKKINEPPQDTVEIYDYDQRARTWSKDGVVMGDILPFTQDLLSAIYYLRAVDWKDAGETIYAPLNDWKRNYDMRFELGKQKRMNLHSAWVTARSGRPVVELDGKYKMIGTNEVWFTDDARRIPILVISKIRLGSLYAKLVDYHPGVKSPAKIAQTGDTR